MPIHVLVIIGQLIQITGITLVQVLMIMINKRLVIILSSLVLVITGITVFSFFMGNTNTETQDNKVNTIEKDGLLPTWNLSKATKDSQYIIEGKVQSIMPTRWNTDNGEENQNSEYNDTIYHDVKFKVEKIIKGEDIKDNIITLRIYSGVVEDKGVNNIKQLIDKDQPEFSLNENCILFLVKDDSDYNKKNENVYLVYNCINGKYDYDVNSNIVSSKNGEKKNIDKFKEEIRDILKSNFHRLVWH